MFNKRRSFSKSKKNPYKLDELVLKNAKIRFCQEQLFNLNFIFNKRLDDNELVPFEKSLELAKSVTERLVQRLVCGAGMLDSRFASKFLVTSHDCNTTSDIHSMDLEYLVRLDNLSTPSIYLTDPKPRYSVIETDADYPAGYARVRLHTSLIKPWGEFINANGYLRRDKVQARLIELLAQSAAMDSPNSPLQVDESILCGIPGKVVDPATLYNILMVSAEKHVFYGPGGNVPRFPDPRDFRLAIVDEPDGIRIRIEFLSPALADISINVRLLVAIGVDAWPASTDFPSRISLGHSDCFLFHRAAQTGMFLVGYGVQSSAWQIRVPAAEFTLLNHYGTNSNIRSILDVLYDILQDIDSVRNASHNSSYKILNKYMLVTALMEELEANSSTPSDDLINWSPTFLSAHILRILDNLIGRLKAEHLPNYFFRKSNLLVNPGHLSDEDYNAEAGNVKAYILRLFDESITSLEGDKAFGRMLAAQESEMVLLCKWKELIDGLLPPAGTRGRRFCFAGSRNRQEVAHTQYTVRQLEYIGLLLKSVLNVRQHVLSELTLGDSSSAPLDVGNECALEDVIFVLVTIMDQARDQYLTTSSAGKTNKAAAKNKLKSQYNNYTSKLVDLIRKDRDCANFEDDLVLVKVILKWLYKAIDQNKRHLAPVLRPYLQKLFHTSHCLSWHLDSIRQKLSNDELDALGAFAQLVNNKKITPAEGLLDAVQKQWIWAKSMLDMVENHTLRVVFIAGRGQVYRHILSLPSYQKKGRPEDGCKTLETGTVRKEIKRQKTMPNRSYFNSILKDRQKDGAETSEPPQHDNLRNNSPLTLILSSRHRRGDHRGCGDIFQALLSMHKLNIFQEITTGLPQEDRVELAELIHNLQLVKNRRLSTKKWSTTLPTIHRRSKVGPLLDDIQKYTPKEESAGIRIESQGHSYLGQSKGGRAERKESVDTLLGTCRAVRLREDSNVIFLQDSFKIRALLNKSDSIKY